MEIIHEQNNNSHYINVTDKSFLINKFLWFKRFGVLCRFFRRFHMDFNFLRGSFRWPLCRILCRGCGGSFSIFNER